MRSRCKILVLGEPVSAEVISQKLRALGYETHLQTAVGLSRLRPLGDPESLHELRRAFIQFASQIASQSDSIGIIHPGSSAWAERPELIPLASRLNLRVIGPPARIQYLFGNQLLLLGEAEKLGIPNLIQTSDPMSTVRELEDFLARSGQKYPFVLRSVRGGGSSSNLIVRDETFLRTQVPAWFDHLRRSLGEVIFILERYIEGARKILVPFVRFRNGRIQLFPTSDVSLQSRYRKIVEFCPAYSIDAEIQNSLRKWTAHLIESCDFVGLGHLEFLVDGTRVFLKAGAARLNTGFHLWEEVAGTNALAWQLAASDLPAVEPEVPQEMKPRDRWRQGILVKILCEDSRVLLPRPGLIFESASPSRVAGDSELIEYFQNYKNGDEVDPQDSGTLAHLYAFSENFQQAMSLGASALQRVWFAGSLNTNEKFVTELLSHPWVKEGIFHTEFVDEEFLPSCHPPVELSSILAQMVSHHPILREELDVYFWYVDSRKVLLKSGSAEEWRWVEAPLFWSEKGLPGVSGRIERLTLSDEEDSDGGEFKPQADRILRVCAYPTAPGKWSIRAGQWFFNLRRLPESQVKPSPPRENGVQSEKKTSKLNALVSGQVRALLFRDGAVVSARDPVLVVESLGALVPHSLPFSIRVTHWKVSANDQVLTGQTLAEFEILSP
jgi:biotin carboxylase